MLRPLQIGQPEPNRTNHHHHHYNGPNQRNHPVQLGFAFGIAASHVAYRCAGSASRRCTHSSNIVSTSSQLNSDKVKEKTVVHLWLQARQPQSSDSLPLGCPFKLLCAWELFIRRVGVRACKLLCVHLCAGAHEATISCAGALEKKKTAQVDHDPRQPERPPAQASRTTEKGCWQRRRRRQPRRRRCPADTVPLVQWGVGAQSASAVSDRRAQAGLATLGKAYLHLDSRDTRWFGRGRRFFVVYEEWRQGEMRETLTVDSVVVKQISCSLIIPEMKRSRAIFGFALHTLRFLEIRHSKITRSISSLNRLTLNM